MVHNESCFELSNPVMDLHVDIASDKSEDNSRGVS